MTRYSYNQQANPPAPFVHVTLGTPGGAAQLADLPAQIDTGAYKTVIPAAAADQLGLTQYSVETATGLEGRLIEFPTFLIEVTVRQQKPITVEVLASRQEPFVLLGRDVLNHFRLILDGPNLALEIG